MSSSSLAMNPTAMTFYLGKVMLLFVFTLPLLVQGEINSIALNTACSPSSVFDIAGLVCIDCDEGLQPVSGENSSTCSCSPALSKAREVCSIDSLWQGTCKGVTCAVDSSLSERCLAGDSMKYDSESNQCTCKNPLRSPPTGTNVATKKLVEIYDDETGSPINYDCVRCPERMAVITADLYKDGQQYHPTAGVRYLADPTVCASCPDHNMFFDTDYECHCMEGFILTGEASIGPQSCIERYPTISSDDFSKVAFKRPIASGGTLDSGGYDFTLNSIIHSHYYLRSASLCEFFQSASDKSLESCQTLANLCVMSMYDENSAACKQYSTIHQRRLLTYHAQEEWKKTLPWLYYAGDAEEVVNDKGIEMKMAFNNADINASTEISFKLAKYKLDGTLVGIEDLTNQFHYCSNSGDRDDTKWKRFGVGHRVEYDCDINKLADKEMFFYDMFLVDNKQQSCKGDTGNFECLYPVPIVNRNFVERKAFPNMNLSIMDEGNDRHTRRFFLFDNLSGITSSGLEAIVYAKSILLSIQVQSESPDKLTPSRLIIEYDTKIKDPAFEEDSPSNDLLLFKVDYSMKTDTFWESIQILIGFVAAFALVVFGIKMNNWQSRQLQPELGNQNDGSLTSMTFIIHSTMILCHTFVLLFFPFAVIICSYWYIFFKLQDSVFLLLPADIEFYPNVGNEYYFLMLAFQGLFVSQTLYLVYTLVGQCRSKVIFLDWERAKGRSSPQVSTWRRIFVANEYLSMSTTRKQSIEFNLVMVGFLITLDDTHSGHINIALRFASICFFWCLGSGVQWIWRFLFYERFYSEPCGQRFVDLCSVSNISLVLLAESFKGYYIHGRSPYQRCDCSMEEMIDSLRKEAQGHTIKRGLEAASQGDQVFVFFCSVAFRNQINKIYNFIDMGSQADTDNHVGKAELGNFLKGFIDQQPPPHDDGLKYVIREPLISETILGVTPADFRQSNRKCIMQPDRTNWSRDYQFLSQTFLGKEMDLLLHDILMYNAFDLMFNNSALTIFLTYMVHVARTVLTAYFTKKNIANTSHIDERFLL